MARQQAIVEVIKQFELAKALKQRLRQRYVECKDISAERKSMIDQFLSDEAMKDAPLVRRCGVCFTDTCPNQQQDTLEF